jgi:hypothetical protein
MANLVVRGRSLPPHWTAALYIHLLTARRCQAIGNMRSTFPSASFPACGDDRMYDLHHGLLDHDNADLALIRRAGRSLAKMDARAAGMIAAQNAHAASDTAATPSAPGSQNCTLYSWAESRWPAPTASGIPGMRRGHATQCPAQHHLDHCHTIGAERHPYADLVRALRHRVGSDTVESDRGERQRHDAEPARETRHGARLVERAIDLLLPS